MTSKPLAYIYQLQKASFDSLKNTNFKIAVIDKDDAHLTSAQLHTLTDSGKAVMGYLSIGEAENYRDYWQSSWNKTPPSFLLGRNGDWAGCYNVKFWDPAWQKLIIDKAVAMAKEGYSGLCLDVVDCYTVKSVAKAYTGPGTARDAMMAFVSKISDAVHAVNANFKLIQNNALDLLVVNPNDPHSATNTAYLSKIDAVNAESTFYLPDGSKTTWADWNVEYLKHAVDAGKTVFAIDYPSSASAQNDFVAKAIADHFVPFVGNTSLSQISPANDQIMSKLAADALSHFLSTHTTTADITQAADPLPIMNSITGTDRSETINGGSGHDMIAAGKGADTVHGGSGNDHIDGGGNADDLFGDSGNDLLFGGEGNDRLTGGSGDDHLWGGANNDKFFFYGQDGHDVIEDFAAHKTGGGDVIYISSKIYATKADILSHVTYDHGNAIIHLDGDNTITVAGIPDHGLISTDFQIA